MQSSKKKIVKQNILNNEFRKIARKAKKYLKPLNNYHRSSTRKANNVKQLTRITTYVGFLSLVSLEHEGDESERRWFMLITSYSD